MKIVSELTGGLGNQLFQYATGFAAAARVEAEFRLDTSHYVGAAERMPFRPYRLDRLNISAAPASAWDMLRVKLATRVRPTSPRHVRVAGTALAFVPKIAVMTDAATGYDPRLVALKRDTLLRGCWQSERFFREYRAKLLDEFTFTSPPRGLNAQLVERITSGRAIGVHFRRTDYLTSDTTLQPCSLDYYARALAWMADRIGDATYFIFSDDPEWVRRNASLPPNSVFITHNHGVDDAEDLRLMMACDHFIIANSSFSWWGAWLSHASGKHVVAPRTWFAQGDGNETDLVPAAWVRL